MPNLFGNYNPDEVVAIKIRTRREAREAATDRAGRTADDVWKLWCNSELAAGRKPPFLCPVEIIEEVKRERAARS